MQAIVYTTYGPPDVLSLKEVAKPALQDDEVLINVHAVGLNAADWHTMKGEPFMVRLMTGGILKPKYTIPGFDIAGKVASVGKNVTEFQVGDDVFGDISATGGGGLAEYVCAPVTALADKPANLSFEQAAAVPMAAVTAFQGLRDKGKIQSGQKVLIYGASGGVGTFAVQIAKSFGADVTAVCSTKNLDMVRSIGADHVVDYTQEDFSEHAERYDLIVAANGYKPLSKYRRALSPDGIYVVTGGSMAQIFQGMLLGPLISMTGNQKIGNLASKPNKADLTKIKELLEAGKVVPVIDKCYPLSDAADALRYLGEGHARGKVVITVNQFGK